MIRTAQLGLLVVIFCFNNLITDYDEAGLRVDVCLTAHRYPQSEPFLPAFYKDKVSCSQ